MFVMLSLHVTFVSLFWFNLPHSFERKNCKDYISFWVFIYASKNTAFWSLLAKVQLNRINQDGISMLQPLKQRGLQTALLPSAALTYVRIRFLRLQSLTWIIWIISSITRVWTLIQQQHSCLLRIANPQIPNRLGHFLKADCKSAWTP